MKLCNVLVWIKFKRKNITSHSMTYIPCFIFIYQLLFLQNSVQEIERLTKFLGLQTSVNLSKDIARKCSFENMKNDKKIFESDVWRTAWRKNEPQFYRKGRSGRWIIGRQIKKQTVG